MSNKNDSRYDNRPWFAVINPLLYSGIALLVIGCIRLLRHSASGESPLARPEIPPFFAIQRSVAVLCNTPALFSPLLLGGLM